MIRKEKIDFHLKFLEHVYLVCDEKGEVTSLIKLADEYGIPSRNITPKALQDCEILKQTSRGVYKWKSTAVPNRRMASDLVNQKAKIGKEAADKKKPTSVEPTETRNLVSVEKIRTEAFDTLVRASQAANILGINLLEQNEKTIKDFVSKIA